MPTTLFYLKRTLFFSDLPTLISLISPGSLYKFFGQVVKSQILNVAHSCTPSYGKFEGECFVLCTQFYSTLKCMATLTLANKMIKSRE